MAGTHAAAPRGDAAPGWLKSPTTESLVHDFVTVTDRNPR